MSGNRSDTSSTQCAEFHLVELSTSGAIWRLVCTFISVAFQPRDRTFFMVFLMEIRSSRRRRSRNTKRKVKIVENTRNESQLVQYTNK